MKNIVLTTITGLSIAALSGCNSSSSGSSSPTVDSCSALNSETFNCEKMLNDIVDHSVEPLIAGFSTKVQALKVMTTEYCASITASTPTASETIEFEEAQQAWQETMDVWQQLEVMQFGPLKTERDEFYSWPLNDSCKVDGEVVSALETGYDISTGVTPARRGLDALEYLVFNTDTGITCEENNTSPALKSWNESKTPAEKRADRCGYAVMVSDDLVTRAAALSQAYANYDIANDEGSQHDAANLVSDALFYIDKKTKDAKLSTVLPATSNGAFNPDGLEFVYADAAREAVHNNLIGALAIMNGTAGNGGLKDYLVAAGQSALADEMITELNTAITSSSDTEITQSFRAILTAATDVATCINADAETATTDLEKLCSLDNEVNAFTDDLKGQFVLTLGFTTPSDAEGDND
jgi:predicted lipoprotein